MSTSSGLSESYKDVMTAKTLERKPDMYRPGCGMFTSACRAWYAIHVGAKATSDETLLKPRRTWWFVARDNNSSCCDYIEKDVALAKLQSLIRLLDDEDLVELRRRLIITDKCHFEDLFSEEFVGHDDRLVRVRDLIAAAASASAGYGTGRQFYHGSREAV
jgi:hypothetical protein